MYIREVQPLDSACPDEYRGSGLLILGLLIPGVPYTFARATVHYTPGYYFVETLHNVEVLLFQLSSTLFDLPASQRLLWSCLTDPSADGGILSVYHLFCVI